MSAEKITAADALAAAVEQYLAVRVKLADAGKRAANDLGEPWADASAALAATAREEVDAALETVGSVLRAYRGA